MHRIIQETILSRLPQGEARIEQKLPGHITDLIWIPKRIVFEVQCSPISVTTAAKRTFDLEHLGLHVVWILHQKCIAPRSLAQAFFRKSLFYTTNITLTGHGSIFDGEHEVDLSKPIFLGNRLSFAGDRRQNWLTNLLKKIKYPNKQATTHV